MEKNSRTKNSISNITLNIIFQFINVLGNFIIRSVFINNLSVEYLGINGLYSNILSILSLTELGVGSAIIYSMYKPLKNNNTNELIELVTYFKKIYSKIGLLVLFLGLLIIPFLPFMVNTSQPLFEIIVYYLMFLFGSVSSYFLVYKTTIVTADQKDFILKKYYILILFIKFTCQLFVLHYFKNYFLFLLIQIIMNLIQNVICSKKAENLYPFIKEKKEIKDSTKNSIWKNIKSLFIYQVGAVSLNNTDNILISILAGTIVVGYYSNYSMIIAALSTFTSLIFTSLTSSIGNYNIDSTAEDKYKIFNVLELASFWIYGFCSICLFVLFQDFISIWLGTKFLLTSDVVFIIVLNYYITGILYPIFCYRTTTNLFQNAKYIMLIAAIVNLILSILLGYKFGLFGILIATAISRLCTTIWFEPYILFKNYFKQNVFKYYFKQILNVFYLVIIYFIIDFILSFIIISNIYLLFIIKCIICIIVINIFMLLINFRKVEFKYILQKLIHIK